MRYTHLLGHAPPSPSTKPDVFKAKNASANTPKAPRLPTSRHHHIRKTSLSTTSSNALLPTQPSSGAVKKPQLSLSLVQDAIVEVGCTEHRPPPTPKPPIQIKAWKSYLKWLRKNEEPSTLWNSSLSETFEDCLSAESGKASECALRVDDVYWSFYLPLDPLHCQMEDRILSGYLLHVWTMFIELGKRIPYNDEGQDRLVELLRELVHLPPMEVRTWDVSQKTLCFHLKPALQPLNFGSRATMRLGQTCRLWMTPCCPHGMTSVSPQKSPWIFLIVSNRHQLYANQSTDDPEIQHAEPEGSWVNYFAFLGRLVAADVTPDWWEIPATTLKEVLAEDAVPNPLTKYKTMALAEFINQAGDVFLEWCMDSGILDVNKNYSLIEPLMASPIKLDWYQGRKSLRK